MATGTVKWFNGQKGFGFIQPDDGGADVFVHISAVERSSLGSIHEGQKLGYELERQPATARCPPANWSRPKRLKDFPTVPSWRSRTGRPRAGPFSFGASPTKPAKVVLTPINRGRSDLGTQREDTMADEFILHHYDTSPFSEKVRVVFGLKGQPGARCRILNIMPKPDLLPLTGGYRRTPVMQIGADIFCDTQVMLAEIDKRVPKPAPAAGLDWAVNLWADRLFFQATVPIIFGELGDRVPQAFIKDRDALSGRPFDTAAMMAAALPMRTQWRAQAAWIENQLAAAKGPWMGGAEPSLADAAAYMNIWFLEGAMAPIAASLMRGMDRLIDWKARLRAYRPRPTHRDGRQGRARHRQGRGHPRRRHPPRCATIRWVSAPALPCLGDGRRLWVVTVSPALLVAANPQAHRHRAGKIHAVGTVHVHFPRAGYIAAPA